MRIAVACFSHETLTFCPEQSTLEAWEAGGIRYGPDALNTKGEAKGYITGYKEAADNHSDVELVGVVRTGWPKVTGYGSWITKEAFDVITGRIVSRLEEQMGTQKGLDGVLLALHGAMAVTNVPRPEAEIVRRVRGAVGDIPVMVTFDLHANEDVEMANAADGVFVLKTYPHLDGHEIGRTAGECLIMTARGEFKPTMAYRKPKIVSASVFQGSGFHPMKKVYDRCREWEAKGVYCASVAPGFAYADVPDLGASVFVVTDNDQALAEEVAQDLHDLMWSLRESLARKLPKAPEGVAKVISMVNEGTKPVVISYHDDRLGDGTHVIRELLDQGAQNWIVAGLADPAALKMLKENHKLGDKVTVSLGGWLDPISGDPVTVTGTVEYLGSSEWTETGPMGAGAEMKEDLIAALDLGMNRHVVITQRLSAPMSSDPLKAVGLDVNKVDIVVLKDRVHHRAWWDTWSKVDYPVDPPGLGPANLGILEYKYLPWDIYPIGGKYRK